MYREKMIVGMIASWFALLSLGVSFSPGNAGFAILAVGVAFVSGTLTQSAYSKLPK